MPLSEHEQRVLEQMEQALYAEDPRFAQQMVGRTKARAQRRRAALGVVVALGGLGLVLLGVLQNQLWLGGIGFVALVLGAVLIFTPASAPTQEDAAPAKPGTASPDEGTVVDIRSGHPSMGKRPKGSAPKGKSKRSSGGFMQRMEERWEKRRGDQGGDRY